VIIKRIASVGLLLVLLGCGAFGQSPEQVYEQANSLYQQGKVAEARDLYESIVQNGHVSGDIYYNLGNAHYKTGNIAKAILSYERARRLMPSDEDLRHNLQLANLLITDRIEPAPRLFVWDTWDGVKNMVSTRTATWLAYFVFIVLALSVSLTVVARTYRLRKAGFVASVVTGLTLVVFLTFLFAKIADDRRTDEAIVLASITTVKNSPDSRSSDAFVLHAGVKIQIIDSVSDWVKIRLADGKVGWMEKGAAERI
jgi:tetratricopeptide (TPR) repeat protein